MTRPVEEVLGLEVPLQVLLAAKTMTLGQVLALAPGTVIEFEKPVSSTLDLLLHDRRIAAGRAVRVGENFGLQITDVAGPQALIQSLKT